MTEFQVWILKSGAVCMILNYSHRFYFQKVLRTKKLTSAGKTIGRIILVHSLAAGDQQLKGIECEMTQLDSIWPCSRHLPVHLWLDRGTRCDPDTYFWSVSAILEMLQRKKNNWKRHLIRRICYSSDTFTCPLIEGHTVRKRSCI